MHSLVRLALAPAIVLGVSAGAVAPARADIAYDGFSALFEAIFGGDYSAHGSPRIGRCAGSSSCTDHSAASLGRTGPANLQ